jgi:hypothetical protein
MNEDETSGIEDLDTDYSSNEDYYDGMYDYCPICGEDWGNNAENHKCNKLQVLEGHKPRFFVDDLDNYSEPFLRRIIQWQNLKLGLLEKPEEVSIEEILNCH